MGQRGRPRHPDLLTPREQDVLALIRNGLTNDQIAERLGLSFETAKHHVATILSKLNVATREAAAAWQAEPVRQRVTFSRIVLGIGSLAFVAALVVGLAFLSYGLSQSDSGDDASTPPRLPTLTGPVYYLPPADQSQWISTPANVAAAGITVVSSPADLEAKAGETAVIIDKDWFGQVNQSWLQKRKLAGSVIVGGRVQIDRLRGILNLTPGPSSSSTPSGRNFYSFYAECTSGNRHDESSGTDYLDTEHAFDQFRLMLNRIQSTIDANRAGCTGVTASREASPTPSSGPNLTFRSLWMADDQHGWLGGIVGACPYRDWAAPESSITPTTAATVGMSSIAAPCRSRRSRSRTRTEVTPSAQPAVARRVLARLGFSARTTAACTGTNY